MAFQPLSETNKNFLSQAIAYSKTIKPMSELMVDAFLTAVENSETINAPKPIIIHLEDNLEWSVDHYEVSAKGGLESYNAHMCYTHIIYQLGETIVLMELQEQDPLTKMKFYKIQ